MYTNVNLAAPLGALALLGTRVSASHRRPHPWLFRLDEKVLADEVCPVNYCAGRGCLSSCSAGFILLPAAKRFWRAVREKHFCEIDCHLAYSVTDVHETKVLGDRPNQLTAAGLFRVLTIKTRFDETTIGRNRGDRLLYPNSRVVSINDENGTQYFPSAVGQNVLEVANSRHRDDRPRYAP